MNIERNSTSSWKLIREIQKRRFEGEATSAPGAITQPDLNDSDGSPGYVLSQQPNMKGPGNSPEIGKQTFLKLALLGIMIAAFLMPLMSSKLLVVVMLVTILGLCGCVYAQLQPQAVEADANDYESTNFLKQENENLQDINWELREREERYSSLSDAFGDMLMDRKADGTITYLNSSFANFLNKRNVDLIGKPFPCRRELIEEGDPENGFAKINIFSLEIEGQQRWLAWVDVPIKSELSTETITRTVARDVSHQKRAEHALRKATENAESASKAKTQFLANVSHEMRTPLNGILGMSGLLADTKLTREQDTYVNAVHDSGIALLTLIEDILDMTLVEAGHLEIRSAKMSPHRLVEDVCELLSSRAHAKDISIGSFVCKEVPETIESDPGRMRQVLINLIGNAIKFTETGGVYVACQVRDDSSGAPQLLFEVQDTGPGIDAKDQRLVFEEFSQADNRSTRKHGGAGLGLAISKRILQEMGGAIGLESQPGKGSRFFFTLPLNDQLPNAGSVSAPPANAGTLALVSENPVTSRVIDNYLTEQGYTLELYDDLKCSLQKDAGTQQRAMLVDVSTTDVPVDELRSLLSDFPDALPKIVLLKPEERQKLDELLTVGFDGYLIKPVRKTSLVNLIEGKAAIAKDERRTSIANKWSLDAGQMHEPKTILLAEDNEINALLARSVLEKVGHAVTRATNGQEALALLEERMNNDPFDLVLLDLQMPVMDGLDALEKIREKENRDGTSALPVYILTADEQETSRKSALASGATGFLTKPLEPEKLLGVMDRV